mgnify:FL=1
MQKRREDRNNNREKVLAFLIEFVRQHGYSPSIREIGQAVGLKSPSTVYNHLRRLEEEGRIAVCQKRPHTLETARVQIKQDTDRENLQRRVRIDLADGGTVYLDYEIEKPKAAPVEVTFGGILDAKQIRGKVSRVIAFCVEQNDEEQEGTK